MQKRTRKQYLAMLKIWSGARWSEFARRWLGGRRTSKILTFVNKLKVKKEWSNHISRLGNFLQKDNEPMPGCFDVPDLRDFKVSGPKKQIKLPLKTSNWKNSKRESTNQKQTMRCSAFGTETGQGITDSIEAQKAVYHDPLQLWHHQLSTGASEKYGDYIQNALKNLLKYGFTTKKKDYKITEYRIFRGTNKDLMRWLAIGKVIITGIYVRKDSNYGTNYQRAYFNKQGNLDISNGQKVGGHLQALTDYETREDGVWFFFPNTYGKDWGNADGGVWVHESQINDTMSKYIIFDSRDDL